MGDGYKFCTQSMQHLSEIMLNLFVVSANCHYDNFLLVTTKSNKENIYCDGKGSIPSFLSNGRHVSRLLDFVIILIILFWILKTLILEWEFPQNMIPYDIIECK